MIKILLYVLPDKLAKSGMHSNEIGICFLRVNVRIAR